MQRDPAAPPDLDGYTAVRVLGLGGFSDVFLYQQELPRRQVAVKVLSPRLTDEVRAAFVREANLMAALSTHPYIVTVYQAGVARDGRPYLVMEYCSRAGLAERYKRRPLSVPETLRTGIRIAGAVATLHGAGILHRDIKPANVLTNDYGWPALTDFGIATAFAGDAVAPPESGSRDDGSTVGLSVPWSPPEMFVDVPDPDVRSDVFSLAATLHTVLAGRTPFEVDGGPNGELDLIARIERGEVTPMARTDVPVSLLAALARGMAPRREDRWPTALDLARALQRIELELGYAPTGIELPSEAPAAIRDPDGEDEDATRLRALPTGAQPTAGAQAGGSAVASDGSAVAGDPAPAAVDPTGPRASGSTEAPGRRRWTVAIVVRVLAILAVAAVVVLLVAGLPRDAASGPPLPAPTDGAATVSADGASVTFTWTNPAPERGDVYYWARAESPDDRRVVSRTRVTVADVAPGSRVCIDVELARAGRTSAPERICAVS